MSAPGPAPAPSRDPEPGDVVEIETPAGLAYVQLTHRHASYPPVVRALPGLHAAPPADPVALAAGPTAFVAMVPLAGALGRLGLRWRIVGHAPVPGSDRAFPTFRMPVRDRRGEVAYWWLWDGEGLTHVAALDPAEACLPLREVPSAERFLARLTESGGP